MAKSIRYLTISQVDHESHDDATNKTVYQEFENMNTIELWSNTNKTFMKALQDMHSEITTIRATESSDIQRLRSQLSAQLSAQKTAVSSELGTIQTELHKLKDTLFGTLKPTSKFLLLHYLHIIILL